MSFIDTNTSITSNNILEILMEKMGYKNYPKHLFIIERKESLEKGELSYALKVDKDKLDETIKQYEQELNNLKKLKEENG